MIESNGDDDVDQSFSIQIQSLTTKSGDRAPTLQHIRIDVAVITQCVESF